MTEIKKSRASIARIVEALKSNTPAVEAAKVCFDVGFTDGAMAAVDYLLEEKAIASEHLPVIQALFRQLVDGTQTTHTEFLRKLS